MTVTDSFLARKERELRIKLGGLPQELEKWRSLALSNAPLRKNHSQLDRVTLRIEGFQRKIERELTETVAAGNLWRRAEALEGKALMVHMIWDFFRIRFSQRTQAPFHPYLALADAFARACYEPAIRLLKNVPQTDLCATPLVTFNDQVSPWATAIEQLPPDAEVSEVFTAAQFSQAVASMPVAIVGVPWSYLTYLPHMALVAHEVAHAVERDGALTDTLKQGLQEEPLVSPEHKAAWLAWMREVFADLYGCWMSGPAFVWSLADYLANDPARIAKQTRPYDGGDWTSYPTATLRVRFACHVLERRQFPTEAREILRAWQSSFPEALAADPLADFEQEFDGVSDCLVRRARLDEIKPVFTPALQEMAVKESNRLAAGANLSSLSPYPPQMYVSAARLLMSRFPEEPRLLALWQRLVDHHADTQTPEVLGANARGPGAEPGVDPEEERRQGELLDRLF